MFAAASSRLLTLIALQQLVFSTAFAFQQPLWVAQTSRAATASSTTLTRHTLGRMPSTETKSASRSASPVVLSQQPQQQQQQQFADNNSGNDISDDTVHVPVQAGTHDELMYALGVNLARQLGDIRPLVESGEELAQVAKGLLDTVVGRLNDDGQREILRRRGTELNDLIATRANSLREKLERSGREMLQKMAQTEGVQQLNNGVVLHVLEYAPDEAVRPTVSSTVLIHYHGTLSDGTVFDSTMGGEPAKFPLAQVIPGWRDGVLHMKEGDTAMIGIPPEQAYGAQGTPDGRIPGGSTIFFKVQLVKVLSAGIGGAPSLLGPDGNELGGGGGSGLIGVDGRPL